MFSCPCIRYSNFRAIRLCFHGLFFVNSVRNQPYFQFSSLLTFGGTKSHEDTLTRPMPDVDYSHLYTIGG